MSDIDPLFSGRRRINNGRSRRALRAMRRAAEEKEAAAKAAYESTDPWQATAQGAFDIGNGTTLYGKLIGEPRGPVIEAMNQPDPGHPDAGLPVLLIGHENTKRVRPHRVVGCGKVEIGEDYVTLHQVRVVAPGKKPKRK